jgi:hypothetical protein
VFGVDPDMMENYWNEQYFRGISPPPVVASSEAMLRFVEATRGAVGYVPSCEVDSRVVVIMTLPIDWSRDRWAARCPD